MPEIIKNENGEFDKIMIDGELYPVKKAESVGIAPDWIHEPNTTSPIATSETDQEDHRLDELLNSTPSDNIESKPVDIFSQISDSNEKILRDLIPAFLKTIDKKMSQIDTTIHKDNTGMVVDRQGRISEIPDVFIDKNGELESAIFTIQLWQVYQRLEDNSYAKNAFNSTDALAAFVSTKSSMIAEAIDNSYPTIDMQFTFLDEYDNQISYKNGSRDQENTCKVPRSIRIAISKNQQDERIIEQELMFEVLRERISYYCSPDSPYAKLSDDLSEIFYRFTPDILSNNEIAAMRGSGIDSKLPTIYKKILCDDNDSIFQFIKSNYKDIFEYMMEYNMYLYYKKSTTELFLDGVSWYHSPTIEIRSSPKWYSYITQPSLRKKKKKKKRSCDLSVDGDPSHHSVHW